MRNVALSTLVEMVKGELMVDSDSEVSPGGDAMLKTQIATMQKWLALRYGTGVFPFLRTEAEVSLEAGTRYYDFPEVASAPVLDLARPVETHCYFGELWNTVDYGIEPAHYNSLNPALDQRCDPVTRWQMFNDAGTLKFEVWPLPATDMTFRFAGQRVLKALTADADTCDLDDILIVQFTAAKLAARMKSTDAQALLAQAQETLKQIRQGYPQETISFNTAGGYVPPKDWERPTVATMISP